MATGLGKSDLAAKTKDAKHAGIAKKLSKGIASPEDRFNRKNDLKKPTMKNPIRIKS